MEGGTTFFPPHTHTEIIECLHRYIHSGISNITKVDVYSAAPYNLVGDGGHGGPYYFLSPVRGHGVSARRSRAVDGTNGKGYWHTEVGKKRVEGTAGGYMSYFSYKEKTASGTTRPGWLMVEYSIDGRDDAVIAKIYRSSRRQATNVSGAAAAHGAPQFFAGQYNVSGAAATAHREPQFLAGQYDVSGAAAAAHGATHQFHAGLYNVSGAAADLVGSLPAELANYTGFPNHDNDNHGALQYAIAGQYNVSGAAAAAHGATHQFHAGLYNVSGAAATAYGAPQFLAGQDNVSGASQASAAHYLTAALQVSPGHADHAILGHSQTVLNARYEVQGQVAQHLIPEPAVIVGQQRMLADEVVIPSTSGGLANLDFDADPYAW